jgi:hypothetical protein
MRPQKAYSDRQGFRIGGFHRQSRQILHPTFVLIGKSAVIGESQGAEHCPTTRECSLIKGGARQVPLNQLWELLPAADQEEIGRTVDSL